MAVAFRIWKGLPSDVWSPDTVVSEHNNKAVGGAVERVSSNVLNHLLHDIMRYLLLQWNRSTEPFQQRGLHPKQHSVRTSAPRMSQMRPWRRILTWRAKERQETVGSRSTEVMHGTFPHASGRSSSSPVCGWSVSAPLHTRESRRTRRRRREAYCRSWRKLFRGDSLPLSRENSINYLHWQMFTDPNMHEFVELAGFPQPNLLLFTMRAEAVVILAVLQRALIWAVSTTNHFGGNYFTP